MILFILLINPINFFMKAENEGLKTKQSRDYFLLASWLAMAAAEVDRYEYSKYTIQERQKLREEFYKKFRNLKASPQTKPLQTQSKEIWEKKLGTYFIPESRVDLIPTIALERLGLHEELCVLKWGEEASTQWKREGFTLSKRISSLKRHFDGVHQFDTSEDHVAHLIWNFMAVYHVLVIRPDLNDLFNYEEIRNKKV